MTLPNFLIIGAAKSGTTSLFRYLGQHPQIYTNVKEPSFFAFEGQQVEFAGPGDQQKFVRRLVTDFAAYQALFDEVTNEIAYGEASVIYLYSPIAAARIKHYIPEVKLIAVLRNPVDRAFSSFSHLRRDGRESLADFAEAIEAEAARVKANWQHQWHYTRLGFYHRQLKRYFDIFHPDQIAVYTYDEYTSDPVTMLQSIFRFLSVDPTFVPNMEIKYNRSGTPRSRALHTFLIRPNRVKDMVRPVLPLSMRRYLGDMAKQWNVVTIKPEFPEEIRRYLLQLYQDEILQLESLIKRDLSNWLVD